MKKPIKIPHIDGGRTTMRTTPIPENVVPKNAAPKGVVEKGRGAAATTPIPPSPGPDERGRGTVQATPVPQKPTQAPAAPAPPAKSDSK
jgi:hypothetical protein